MSLTANKLIFFGPLSFDISDPTDTATNITAGSFVVGQRYVINVPGTTDFTLIGAADSLAGTEFEATGIGTGTGTAYHVTKFTRLNLKPEAMTVSYENKKGNMVYEDGNEEDWSEGLKMTAEILVSELDTTDIIAIETGNKVIVTLDNGSVVTIAATNRIFVDVENGKTKIVIWKTAPIGSAVTALFTIA